MWFSGARVGGGGNSHSLLFFLPHGAVVMTHYLEISMLCSYSKKVVFVQILQKRILPQIKRKQCSRESCTLYYISSACFMLDLFFF